MYNPYQDALHQRYPRALIVGHRDLSHDRDCPCDHGLYLDNHSLGVRYYLLVKKQRNLKLR
jgi:hypothetical protein